MKSEEAKKSMLKKQFGKCTKCKYSSINTSFLYDTCYCKLQKCYISNIHGLISYLENKFCKYYEEEDDE